MGVSGVVEAVAASSLLTLSPADRDSQENSWMGKTILLANPQNDI
jgi:hypothetical protein